ncbi:hypothetical protein Q31a_59110 [Aureliella helgolandensis]|uniref:Uncharacterized protein n=1 Tax=Aureliella helgolandensis TaxID=2527968 RepID=A0A518GFZ6_9BACT|nr:hypothetical protein Q31a_59110 [Aureliella helgolandensis]
MCVLQSQSCCSDRTLLGVLRHFDDVATHVVPALRAYRVGRNYRAALRAVARLLRFDLMVRAPFSGSRIGMSTLWNCHGSKYLSKNID